MHMNEKMSYPEAVENTAHVEYLACEAELEALQERLDVIISEQGEDAVPQALLMEISLLYRASSLKLKDWLDSLNLD